MIWDSFKYKNDKVSYRGVPRVYGARGKAQILLPLKFIYWNSEKLNDTVPRMFENFWSCTRSKNVNRGRDFFKKFFLLFFTKFAAP